MYRKGKATIVDIADRAGVSKSTVSLVLQGSPLVKDQTSERVRQVIEELGYVYNRSAANLRRARTNIVGLVINDLTVPFIAEMAVGIERVFQEAGIVPIMANTAESLRRQGEVFQTMLEQNVAGLIVLPARGTAPSDFRPLRTGGVPTVLALRNVPGSQLASICADNRGGAFQATEHLLALGHRRIAFLGGFENTSVFQERLAGYRRALADGGVPFDEDLVVQGPASRQAGHDAVKAVLTRAVAPTAAFCFSDVVGLGAIEALRAAGMEPGGDFSLVGFDDVAEARYARPPLSSVAVNYKALGERAAHAILGMLHAGDRAMESFEGPVELIIRDSCFRQNEAFANV
ncbi:MAG: LacI family DNA-binding transcriptional regulator [Pseudomonadota bacterium]